MNYDTTIVKIDTQFVDADTTNCFIQITRQLAITPEPPQFNHWFGLWIAIAAGLLGGTLVYFLTKDQISGSSYEQNKGWKASLSRLIEGSYWKQLLLGIVGAFLVPLLLYLTNSTLFGQLKDGHNSYFIFGGYCLIGAVFARGLLNSIAKRFELGALEEEVKKLKANEDAIAEYEHLREANPDDALPEMKKEVVREIIKRVYPEASSITDTEVKAQNLTEIQRVFLEMKNPKHRDRSVRGLVKTTRLNEMEVEKSVSDLLKQGLIMEVSWYHKTFYRLTEKGITTQTNTIYHG